jgi:aldehyde:ferredoxin oxidoreductase
MKTTPKDLEIIADRVYNLERAFIAREGITRKHDMPPWKSFNVPIPRGPLEGAVASEKQYEDLLDKYYKQMGWDIKTGLPTRSTLEKLKLESVADELERDTPFPEWEGPILWSLEKYPHGGTKAEL